jgi:hypothetical protein
MYQLVCGWFFIKGILRVVKPAFKEQIWFLRLENAQITNLSLIFELLLRTTKQGFETAGNAQEASGYL